jgi:hypothetical protein
LNRVLAEEAAAHRYEALADRIEKHFTERFWVGTHFAEYLHPSRGLIATHGLTDVDWAALATGVLRPDQREILWPRLRREQGFYYGGMPTGISTRPESYEPWEFTHPDRHDLAAMGRVWYLEAWARARCGDAEGLLDGLHRVAAEGKKSGYFWRERYHPSKDGPAPAGAEKYCEYPANLIRIVQRFLLGVELRLDGTIVLAPTVPYKYWDHGFGQTLRSCGRRLDYRMDRKGICGTYHGTAPQRLGVWLPPDTAIGEVHAVVDGEPAGVQAEAGLIFLTLPAIKGVEPVRFQLIETTTRRRKT